ncbi:MAG: VWA domain-containing protein, partial [Candidatus Cloacimonetes bacterium]|nr:VWA domain-containing protein [Candidatus Cloacimonadota bacterium]
MQTKQFSLLVLLLLCFFSFAIAKPVTDANLDDLPKGQLLPAPFAPNPSLRDDPLLSSTPIYTEPFEPVPGNWTMGTGWFIGVDGTTQPKSAPNTAFTQNPYDNNADYNLLSPQIIIPEATEPGTRFLLNLWGWWSVESNYDFVHIDVLVNGVAQTTLFSQTGVSGWEELSFDISAFAGETIQLRFRLTSNSYDTYAGFGVDSISILKNVYEVTPVVNLLSLNTQNFPFVYSTISVALEGEDMSNLSASNFQVYENDVLQTNFFNVIPPSTGTGTRLVDIAFLMDNSGSMSSSINAVSANVTSFVNNLANSGVDSALGLCRYGQSANNGNPILEDQGILTTNLTYFRDNVWNRNRIDGGYEPGYYAMTQSLSGFNWRPGSQKVMICITDETPDQGGSTLNDALAACTANGAILFALTYSGLYGTFTPITEPTGGNVFDIYSNFDAILTQISQIIVSNYIVSYRSSNPAFDGTERNLRIVVNYNNTSAEVTGVYYPGQTPQITRTPATIAMDSTPSIDNQDLVIQAVITDSYAPFTTGATLYYQTLGRRNYVSQAMVDLGNNLWQGIIPAASVQAPGVGYYLSATDGQSTSTLPSTEPSNNPFTIAVLPNVPPEITHSPAAQVQFNQPLNVSVNVTDNTLFIDSVELFYRRYSQLSYTSVPMELVSGNLYSATIPGSVVSDYGVEYFIRATDNYGSIGSSGFADTPHFVPALLDGTIIQGGAIPQANWSITGSPYYINQSVYIPDNNTLTIQPGTILVFGPNARFDVNGGINASGITFTAEDPTLGWQGIYVESTSNILQISNSEIRHAVVGFTFQNSGGLFYNNIISKDSNFPNEVALQLNDASSPLFSGLQIINYSRGIVIDNQVVRTVSSPVITNVRIRNTSSSIRNDNTGIKVMGAVGLSLDDAVIEEYDEGIYWDGQGTSDYRTTPVITNVRIRNTNSSIRNASFGMKLLNLSSVQVENDSIGGYPEGLIMDSQTTRTTTNGVITNVRIRNTNSSIRTDSYGARLNGSINATLTNLDIEDYVYGLHIQTDSTDVRTATSAVITNVRIRNTNSSIRTETIGAKLIGGVNATIDGLQIEDYYTGLLYMSNGMTFERNIPTLNNITIRNTDSLNNVNCGMKLLNLSSVHVENDSIGGYPNGLVLDSGTNRTTTNAMITNVRIRNTNSSIRTDSYGAKLNGSINAELSNLDIDDYAYGLHMEAASTDLRTTASAIITNVRIRNTNSSIRTETVGATLKGGVYAEIDGLDIDDYYTGLLYHSNGTSFGRNIPSLNNIKVRSTNSDYVVANGIQLINLAGVTAENDSVDGYPNGFSLDNSDPQNPPSVPVTIANMRIKNRGIEGIGAKLNGSLLADFFDVQIDDFATGLHFTGDATNPSAADLENVRIRNANPDIRTTTNGMQFMDLGSITALNGTIEGFGNGIIFHNANRTRTSAQATITNVRIRNTNSSIRTETIGTMLMGNILANIDGLDIDDFNTGVYYEGNGTAFERTTPVITNVRIRNTNSSIRSNPVGIMLKNLAAVDLQKNVIFPSVEDTPNANAAGQGVVADGVGMASISQNTIWGFQNGISLNNGSHAAVDNTVIWKNGVTELNDPILLNNGTAVVTNSDISFAGSVYPGAGNLDKDPKFVSPKLGNFYLKPRSPLKDTPIGALPYDFEKIAAWHNKEFHPGWNLTGMPYLTRATGNTPVAIFGDDLSPFYVAPSYTSILQLNQNTMPDSLG